MRLSGRFFILVVKRSNFSAIESHIPTHRHIDFIASMRRRRGSIYQYKTVVGLRGICLPIKPSVVRDWKTLSPPRRKQITGKLRPPVVTQSTQPHYSSVLRFFDGHLLLPVSTPMLILLQPMLSLHIRSVNDITARRTAMVAVIAATSKNQGSVNE